MPTPSEYGFRGVDIADANLGQFQEGVLHNAMNYSSNVVLDWASPQRKEERQMAQQWINDELEPSYRMSGLKRAGINPLTAAGGIAQSSSSSPQPSSSVNPIGDVAGAVGSVAGAFEAAAGGVSTLGKLIPEIGEINSNSQKNLAAAGLDKVNTDAVMTDNKYRAENWEAELNVKRQSFKNMQQELTNMKATHREIMTHCDEMISQIELNGSQKDYYDTMQLKIQEDLRWQKALNDWCLSNNLMIRDSGVDGYIFNLLYNEAPEGDVDAFFDAYYDYCKNRSYATTRGLRDAEIDTAFDKAFNEALANTEVAAAFKPYMDNLDVIKENFINFYKELYKFPNNPIQLVTKFVDLILKVPEMLGMDFDYNSVGRDKPNVSSKKSN